MAAGTLSAERLTATRDELALQRGFVEGLVGRPLRLAEQAVDVLTLLGALKRAKEHLVDAIREETRLAVKRALRQGVHGIRIEVNREMLRPLEQLYELGRREGRAELERQGYEPRAPSRAFEESPRFGDLDPLAGRLRTGLSGLSWRVEDELVRTDLTAASTDAIAKALMRTPGARNIASQVVSTAMTSGFAATFEENADLVGCWEYSAVLDAATCERCQPLDGREYHSWEEVQVDLPGGGPNPTCLGGGRCRCRAVPCPADEATITRPPEELHPDRVPNAENATVDKAKITGYLLDPAGNDPAKARFFANLGYTATNWRELRDDLLAAVLAETSAAAGATVMGEQKFSAVVTLGAARKTRVFTVCAIGEDGLPRLVTARPARGEERTL